jgi:TonB family protein
MRVQFSPSIDFNQMLVFSVFWHLLLLTVVLFLPKTSLPDTAVVPAFMVNLVSEPMGSQAPKSKHSKPHFKVEKSKVKNLTPKALALKRTTVSKPAVVKEVPASKGILAALNKLESNTALPPKKKMIEELDQLARLEKPKQKPLASKRIKKKTVTEETFRELEVLKNKRIGDVKAVAPAPLQEDILKDFEDLKVEESLLETQQKEVSAETPKKQESEKTVTEKPQAPEVDLLKELKQLAKLDARPAPEAVNSVKSTQKSSEYFDSIAEKFGLLSVDPEPVRVEVSSAKLDSTSFQSKLRSLPQTAHTSSELGAEDSYVFTEKEGIPGSDIQSLYVGMIQERIYKNWREPLAEEHNQETVVSFFIFSHGNVDKPFVKKSSGVEALDALAVRAVLDSVPFPEFPQGLKMSNLHINIYFKYVPKN